LNRDNPAVADGLPRWAGQSNEYVCDK